MHEAVGELARVGEKQQSGAVQIQPADCNPPARRQRVEHGAPSLRIAPRHELAHRLVVEQHAGRFCLRPFDGLAIHGDFIARAGSDAEAGDNAVDADASGRDPGLDLAARPQARRGEELLNPLAFLRLSR